MSRSPQCAPHRCRRSRRVAAAVALVPVVVLVLVTAACGDDAEPAGPTVDDPAEAAARALDVGPSDSTASDDEGDDATDDEEEPVELDPTTIRGELINEFALQPGDCFDRLEDLQAGRPVVITTRLSCDEPHQFEVFAVLSYPAEHPAVFPGEDIMLDFARRACYLQFTPWAGAEYEVSELEIGVLTPNRENFEDGRARYRGIHCWVEHVDGEPLVGSMRGAGR